MLPSDMNLRIGKVKDYNNKILISSPSFKIGTNVKVNLLSSENRRLNNDGEQAKLKVETEVKSKEVKTEPKVITKPNIKPNKEHKQDVKPNIKFDDANDITYEEEKVALVLGITSVFTVWWMFK